MFSRYYLPIKNFNKKMFDDCNLEKSLLQISFYISRENSNGNWYELKQDKLVVARAPGSNILNFAPLASTNSVPCCHKVGGYKWHYYQRHKIIYNH